MATTPLVEKPKGEDAEVVRFRSGVDNCPAVGGCVGLTEPHSDHLLPPEVVLYEPSPSDIFEGGVPSTPSKRTRQIFLNTPLSDSEIADLAELHKALQRERGDEAIPLYAKPHALRIIQHRKSDMKRALLLIKVHQSERVGRLPVDEADVLDDLRSGFVYLHGRDRSCRPCLVIALERMKGFKHDKERAVRLVIFVLEYALRYAMAPGRVENWVVVMDLLNVSKVISMTSLMSTLGTVRAIAETLESVYCGRMVWMKMFNMPSFLAKPVASVIPAEKAKKVAIVPPSNVKAVMSELMEPHQLEARYGGTAPNLAPEQVYPFHFFPNAVGEHGLHHQDETHSSGSLHRFAPREFHEGSLWDSSTAGARGEWLQAARRQSLTPAASRALSELSGGGGVEPCQTSAQWLALMSPEEAVRREQASPSSRMLVRSTSGLSKVSDIPRFFSSASLIAPRGKLATASDRSMSEQGKVIAI